MKAWKGRFDRKTWAEHGFRIQQVAERFGARIEYRGFHPPGGSCVWAANHMSSLETFCLPSALQSFGDVAVVVKQSLMRYPFFGATVRATDPIAVTRKDPREDLRRVMDQGENFLNAGRSVLLFPQATRNVGFDPRSFNSIAVKLARRAGVPVIPVALTTDFCGIGRYWRDWGPIQPDRVIRFHAGPVLKPENSPRDNQQAIRRFIADRLSEWGYVVDGE